MPFFLFIVAALFFATGGLCMKYSEGLTKWQPGVAVFLCFCAGAALQALGMRTREMGSSYTLVLGLEAVSAVGLGSFFLGERLSGSKVLAMLLILGGIIWLERA